MNDSDTTGRRGFVLVVSAPSGAGKSTLARHLRERIPEVTVSVSTTTRPPRPGEKDGVHYHFVDQETFRARVEGGAFLEWAEVFGNHYGTSRDAVEPVLAAGNCVLLDIDWQGARQVREAMPEEDVVTVFIAPPSQESLYDRLTGRAQDSTEVIAARMRKAAAEMSHWQEYDYVIINDQLEPAQSELVAVVSAERLRRHRIQEQLDAILGTFGNV
ncbi:MAG: guanylate kinase [Magnetococcales bacterium]|nr:guanylate kinase [Magnetococcales bacterium]